jgi:hypothetical protein
MAAQSPWSTCWLHGPARLEAKQGGFGGRTADVAAQGAISAQHPVARHHDRQRVGRTCGPDRAHSFRPADDGGDVLVRSGVPVSDLRQVPLDLLVEPMREREVQREVERSASTGEVLLDLLDGDIEALGCAQDAAADAVGEGLQHRVVVLAAVRDPHQPFFRRGEQQRPDRSVEGRVGDVEQTLTLCRALQAAVKPLEGVGVHRRRQRGSQIVIPSDIDHDHAPFVRAPG